MFLRVLVGIVRRTERVTLVTLTSLYYRKADVFACVGWNSEKNRKGDLSYSNQLYYRKADVFACVGWNSEKNRKGDLSYSNQLYYRKADVFACVGWNSEKNRKGDLSYSNQLYYRKADVFACVNSWTLLVRRTERVTLVTLTSYTIGKQMFLRVLVGIVRRTERVTLVTLTSYIGLMLNVCVNVHKVFFAAFTWYNLQVDLT